MTYQDALRIHLTRYKLDRLKVLQEGIFVKDGRPRSHILPREVRHLNILPAIRNDLWEWWKELSETPDAVTLHRDFHHLNSSQAACLNLFFPFVAKDRDGQAIVRQLGCPREQLDRWAFEQITDEEECTNFDLSLHCASGTYITIEFKLSEADFGGAADNPQRRAKLDKIYRPRLENRIASECLDASLFFKNYQFFRNVSYAGPHHHVVLVFPKANSALRAREKSLRTCLLPHAATYVRTVFLEDLVAGLRSEMNLSEQQKTTLSEFSEKYLN